MTDQDELYLRLMGAREKLCLAQMLCGSADRLIIGSAIERIDLVGFTLPQWSRFDRPDAPEGRGVTAAHSMRLAVAPVAGLVPIHADEANAYLVEWSHDLGPCLRRFRREGWALEVAGRVVSVAISASTISATVPTPWRTYGRTESVELARQCSHPDERWATRPMVRLWREVAAPLWACWTPLVAVSYSTRRHTGDLYRWDGWTLCAEDAGSSGGGTWSAKRAADHAAAGPKRRWAYRLAAA